MGGIATINLMGGLWHCYTHITTQTFKSKIRWLGSGHVCTVKSDPTFPKANAKLVYHHLSPFRIWSTIHHNCVIFSIYNLLLMSEANHKPYATFSSWRLFKNHTPKSALWYWAGHISMYRYVSIGTLMYTPCTIIYTFIYTYAHVYIYTYCV